MKVVEFQYFLWLQPLYRLFFDPSNAELGFLPSLLIRINDPIPVVERDRSAELPNSLGIPGEGWLGKVYLFAWILAL